MFAPSLRKISMGALLLLFGVSLGVVSTYMYLFHFQYPTQVTDGIFASREGGYSFINPLLSCGQSENKQFDEYKPINDELGAFVDSRMRNGSVQTISIYFRSLNAGHWSGVNENNEYSPASLLKVPLMIAYLKEADTDSKVLQKQITFHMVQDQNAVENFKPKKFIQDGQIYTVDELIQYMIVYSDNNAAQLLQDNVNQNSLQEVYSDLNIPVTSNLSDNTTTPKEFGYIFRILYNATYLSKALSQYALALLAQTDFRSGLNQGIPGSIPISHKFGEREITQVDPTNGKTLSVTRELHDCGIIYYPKNPYLLCVMTRGSDFGSLSQVIGDVSTMIYKETQNGVLER